MIAFFGFLRHLTVFGNKSRQAKLQPSLTPTNNNSDSSSLQTAKGEGEQVALIQGVGNTWSSRGAEHKSFPNQKDGTAPRYANDDDSDMYQLGVENGMPFFCCPTPYSALRFTPQKLSFKL